MSFLFNKKITVIFIGLALVTFIGWVVFLFTVLSLSNDVEVLAQELSVRANESNSLSTIRNTVRNMGDDLEKIDNLFVRADRVADFVEIIEKEADIVGIKIEISSIQLNKNTEASVNPLSLSVKADGAWSRLIEFVGRVEQLPYAMYIKRNALTKTVDAEGVSSWRGTFDIVAYVIE